MFRLFSTNLSPQGQASCLSDLLCCLPRIDAPRLSYENVFRVLIVQFMDAHNLDLRALKKSCIHIAQPDGRMIPFEAFNLFYRGKRAQYTARIQASIAEANATGKRWTADDIRDALPVVAGPLVGARIRAAALRKPREMRKVSMKRSALLSTRRAWIAVWQGTQAPRVGPLPSD